MRTVRAGRAVALGGAVLAGALGLLAATVQSPLESPTAIPTQARGPVGADRPAALAAQRTSGGTERTRASLSGTRYATDTADPRGPASQPPLPSGTQEYGDPNAVIVRMPARDYGSGFHGNYGIYPRQTSPSADLAAAVSAPNGCLIIGDSIATTVVKDLVAELRRSAGERCAYDTWPGRATEGTANALLDIKRRYGLPPRIVVMSGTNDIFNPPLFESQMDRIVDGIGPQHQILWVNTFDSRRPRTALSLADERNTAYINSVLTARAARTGNMAIVPWDALFRGNAGNVETLLSDGVHPNEAGVVAMVGLVRNSLG